MMIQLKTAEQIELIRQSCLIVSGVLALMGENIKPGISGRKLDQIAEEYIRDQGAIPGFKGYNGFPSTLCISKNECVVHGIPTMEPFIEGDIVSIDCGSILNEYYGDSAYTFALGEIDEDVEKLLRVTHESLYLGIDAARDGGRIGDIGHAIQDFAEGQHDFSVVRELVGHGIGKKLHEPPEVPNYGKRGKGPRIKEGLVIAIEPMVNLGRKEVIQHSDGWSIICKDKKASAHYEHTIAVTSDGPVTLSNHDAVNEAVKKNINLKHISVKS